MSIITKQKLQTIQDQKEWQDVLDFGDEIIKRWRSSNIIGDTEFETLKLTFEREYKIKGVQEFFETLYRVAYDGEARLQPSEDN